MFRIILVSLIFGVSFAEPLQAQTKEFEIDPRTPLKDLLPAVPKDGKGSGLLQIERLTLVPGIQGDILSNLPQVQLEDAPVLPRVPRRKHVRPGAEHIAQQIARIKHINRQRLDRFVELLKEHRADLAGLPFATDPACRLSTEYSREFARAAPVARLALLRYHATDPDHHPRDGRSFMSCFRNVLAEEKIDSKDKVARAEDVNRARIAAFMHILAAEPGLVQKELIEYLAGIKQDEATQALAQLAIFSFDEYSRKAALQALRKRETRGVTDLLLRGLRYPLPAVAKNAAEAVVQLQRADMVPQLVTFLDEPDPLAPWVQQSPAGRTTWVREVVQINHLRNCLLCHAPAITRDVPSGLRGPIPVPGEELPCFYIDHDGSQNSGTSVRADVTYLRPDFARILAVQNAAPWPEMQRFDFLVRTRELTPREAAAYQEVEKKRGPQYISPNHRAVLTALHQLTGRKAEPTARAWRRELGLPEPGKEKGS